MTETPHPESTGGKNLLSECAQHFENLRLDMSLEANDMAARVWQAALQIYLICSPETSYNLRSREDIALRLNKAASDLEKFAEDAAPYYMRRIREFAKQIKASE